MKDLMLGDIPYSYSVIPLSQINNMPIFDLTYESGVRGGQTASVESYKEYLEVIATNFLRNVGIQMSSIEYSIWPESLIEELAARRCVLFLGSGISATASTEDGIKPKTWGQFIEGIKSIARNASEDDMKYINEQIKKEDYLLALQAIYDACIPADYVRYLKSEFMVDFKPSKVHEFIRKIDSKVVITTNFDSIYDNLCKGSTYSILDYEEAESIVQTLKSPTNLIIKAHGTIQKPTKLIFTSSQYFKSQQENPVFYNILYSLFLTNTVVFLGYGLSDPDINLIFTVFT